MVMSKQKSGFFRFFRVEWVGGEFKKLKDLLAAGQ
jgi:hypothetical protein